MRYLLSVHGMNNDELKSDLVPYQKFVAANAQHVLEYPSASHRNVDAAMVTFTNDLAILTAALAMA
jgi:hypothetical protein